MKYNYEVVWKPVIMPDAVDFEGHPILDSLIYIFTFLVFMIFYLALVFFAIFVIVLSIKFMIITSNWLHL